MRIVPLLLGVVTVLAIGPAIAAPKADITQKRCGYLDNPTPANWWLASPRKRPASRGWVLLFANSSSNSKAATGSCWAIWIRTSATCAVRLAGSSCRMA